jgi:hypothetical protein
MTPVLSSHVSVGEHELLAQVSFAAQEPSDARWYPSAQLSHESPAYAARQVHVATPFTTLQEPPPEQVCAVQTSFSTQVPPSSSL